MSDARDKAAEAYAVGFEKRYIAMNDFKAGWDACANHMEKLFNFATGDGWNELPKLRAENERLKAEVMQAHQEIVAVGVGKLNSSKAGKHILKTEEERDRWIEQAEKLAVALERVVSEKEDNDAPAIYDSEIPFYMTEIAREALADFEAFRSAQSPKK